MCPTNATVKMAEIDTTLASRGSRYGCFDGHAKITQSLKAIMHKSPRWSRMSDDKKEALEMIAHKIGRILNGDPDYKDSWHDIIGYARLIETKLPDDASLRQDTAEKETPPKD